MKQTVFSSFILLHLLFAFTGIVYYHNLLNVNNALLDKLGATAFAPVKMDIQGNIKVCIFNFLVCFFLYMFVIKKFQFI